MMWPKLPQGVIDLYEDTVRNYNKHVEMTQRYFAGDPIRDEEDYDWYSLLYDLHIPTKGNNDDLKRYMRVNQLEWSDVNPKKAYRSFGNGTMDSYLGAVNFVSRNVNRLYR